MKKIFPLFAFLLLLAVDVFACTTFFINKDGQMVFGRNYDWVTGNGMVCTNQKGLSKTSRKTNDGETISWVSRYGSITFNQYGKEFPTGGMNEQGLVVELMWLDGTRYPEPDQRPALGVLQWIQYQLDNCGSVKDIIATDKKIRIASKGTTPLHYLVADGAGNVATIEFIDGEMLVHEGKDLPFAVLTNNSYEESINQTAAAIKSSGGNVRSFTDNSIDRFATACNMVQRFQQTDLGVPVIDYAFNILGKVAQGSHTKWSIVYDIGHKKIYFKTAEQPQQKSLSFSAVDFSCRASSKIWNMNQAVEGDISALLVPFSIDANRDLVEKSFEESASQFTVTEEVKRSTWEYPARISCLKQD